MLQHLHLAAAVMATTLATLSKAQAPSGYVTGYNPDLTYPQTAMPGSWAASGRCLQDLGSGETFTNGGGYYADEEQTVENCAQTCLGVRYMGPEDGDHCNCGGRIRDGVQDVDVSNCYTWPCYGNNAEACGGHGK